MMRAETFFFKLKDVIFTLPRLPGKLWKTQKAALFSGLLIGTSYIPFPPWALFICLIPLWGAVLEHPNESFWKSFWRGWWSQFILSLIGFYWIAYVSHEYGYIPWPISLFILLLFASTVHIYFALATGTAQWLRKKLDLKDWAVLAIMAGLTGLAEIWWPSLFPWNFGYPFLWIQSPVAQVSDVIGFHGLSLFVLFFNAALTWGVHQARMNKKTFPVLAVGVVLIASLTGLYFWGVQKKQEWLNTREPSHLKVLTVQANIGDFEKYMAERGAGFEQSIANQYFALTREGLSKDPDVDLIVWPESAFPDFLNAPDLKLRLYSTQFAKFVQEIRKPILTGGFSHALVPGRGMETYNGLFLYGPSQNSGPNEDLHSFGEPYHKTDLLMFGEYTPFSDTFPILAQISPAGVGFGRGKGPQILPFGDYKIGAQICYESLDPNFTSHLALLGADVLVNLTNDSWFGPTSESPQHMIMTLARGLEARRPLIRSTNTGITTAILADGTQLQRSPQYVTWTHTFDIPVRKNASLTFYTQYGSWLPYLLLIFLSVTLIIGRGRARS
jgi:apolipoprotein N-acyltransferase